MRFDNIKLERALWMMENYPAILIDVRESEEYNKHHLKGAINIPYDDIAKTKFQKEAIYIVYCDNGMQSMRAARDMALEGYRVYNVIGGIKGNEKYVDI
ncbi:MAG: rhodanese-like domain-containing protein [Lachnospiraceae bacterium]|nr:rhodanese-like domain-containing protein [Lachnospiraceae bacterium]